MIELLATGVLWILAGLLFFWIGALIYFPSMGLYRIIEAVTYRFKNSASLAEKKAKKHTQELYEAAKQSNPITKEDFSNLVITEGLHALWMQLPRHFRVTVMQAIFDMHEEGDIDPPPVICNSVEGARYRDRLSRLTAQSPDPQPVTDALMHLLSELPQSTGDDLTVPVKDYLSDPRPVVQNIIAPFYSEEVKRTGAYKELRAQLKRNLEAVDWVVPTDYKKDDVIFAYLHDTPFLQLFNETVSIGIPETARYEHMHVCAPTGGGKTSLFAWLILKDLEYVVQGQRSVVLIDSAGDFIHHLSRLAFVRDRLKDRIVIVDPADFDHPFSLPLFKMNYERAEGAERERLQNSAIDLLSFVFSSGGAELTAKQEICFNFMIRAMAVIPGANILTMRDFLDPKRFMEFKPYLERLSPIAQDFFEKEWNNPTYKDTKDQVSRRVWGILNNTALSQMMMQTEGTFDIGKEMNAGKLIIINTNAEILKSNKELFGRFFIGLISHAAEERASIPEHQRTPTFLYIDEAADYLSQASRHVTDLLDKARKRKIGLVLAHQRLSQFDASLQSALETGTNIKVIGNVGDDARYFARIMHCDPSSFNRPPLSFMAKWRDASAMRITIPLTKLDQLPKMTDAEYSSMIDALRAKYATTASEEAVAAKNDTTTEVAPDSIPPDPKTHQPPEGADVQRSTNDQKDRTTSVPQDTVTANEPDYPKPKKKKRPTIKKKVSPDW